MSTVYNKLIDFSSFKTFISTLTFSNIIPAVLIFVIGIAVIKIVLKLYDKVSARGKLDKNLFAFMRSTLKILMIFIMLLIIADSFGVNVSSLIALLSVVSLAFSLAVQGTLSNIAGGIMILTAHPFKVGDYIEIAGLSGTVLQTGLVYTKILSPDNKEISIPNSDAASQKITNCTSLDKRRADLKYMTTYNTSTDSAKTALLKAVKNVPYILEDPAPFIGISDYKENYIEYIVRVWAKTENFANVSFDLAEKVKQSFDEEGIEMTYPHMNVHIKEN